VGGFQGTEGDGEVSVLFQEELLVGGLEFADGGFGKSPTLEADEVQPAGGGGVAIDDHIGRDVLDDFRAAAGDGVAADVAELVHRGEAGDDGVVLDDDMAAESAVVGEDDVVPDLAVVGDMRVAEEEVVIADDGRRVGVGAAVDGGVFPEDVAVAHEEAGWLALILQVLGLSPNGGEWEELVGGADLRRAVDDDMRVQHAVITELDSRTDDTERPDPDVVAEGRVRGNDRGGVDHENRSQPTSQRMATVFLGEYRITGEKRSDHGGPGVKKDHTSGGKDERNQVALKRRFSCVKLSRGKS